ncbi:MAG: tRNA 2-thiouridine(34) synthase MnmA [Bacillota bacterium]|nr:tRNA 2-thiouridine(34) synthase MnmA [Bacillota bacterium]
MKQNRENMAGARVLLALSGGVDSTVAGLLLREAGADVIGVTLLLDQAAEAEIRRAEKVAVELGIRHEVIDRRRVFRERIVRPFVETYARGQTPNPCFRCNRDVKVAELLEAAEVHGCDWVATGHYAQVWRDAVTGRELLGCGVDAARDQAYMLAWLRQEQLARLLLPCGGLKKAVIRERARAAGLVNAEQADSQDICFIPDGDYRAFLTRERGVAEPAGDFVDLSGRVLGRHEGLSHYTVGQRRGLSVVAEVPLYVRRLDAEQNRVVLATAKEMLVRRVEAGEMNWVSVPEPAPESVGALHCFVRMRYRQKKLPAVVTPLEGGRLRVELDRAFPAPAPGQALVLYDGEGLVLAGGIIEGSEA